ncbi:MAG: hypothetical protein R2795_22545 [Saprospiraceae bacterium]
MKLSSLFEALRRNALPDGDHVLGGGMPIAAQRLAVLTGSLVILPEAVLPFLNEITSSEISYQPLFEDSDYVKVETGNAAGRLLVNKVTQLFSQGKINVLIGTTALLGKAGMLLLSTVWYSLALLEVLYPPTK